MSHKSSSASKSHLWTYKKQQIYPRTIAQPVPAPPAVDFEWWQTENDGVVHFRSLHSGAVTSWHWDFGDGNTSNATNPSHQYEVFESPTQFVVRLTVDGGVFEEKTITVYDDTPATPTLDAYTLTIDEADNLTIGQANNMTVT